jgi:hypothetical protein
MQRMDWTYEVASAGESAQGLEEYVAVGSNGEPVGKVAELLRHDDELFLVLEQGVPPLRHDPRLIPWHRIAEVDHDALTVVLAVTQDELDEAPALDPGKGVEGSGEGHPRVDAVRVAAIPEEIRPIRVAPGNVSGPADRPAYAEALLVGGMGIFALLVAIVLVTLIGGTWTLALLAVPAFLLAAAAVLAYRAWRLPYQQR